MEDEDVSSEKCNFCSCVLYASVLAIVIFLVRRWFKGGQFNERVSAKGKVAVVTGCNTGIGLETVKELNLRGAKVYMLCRNESRAQEGRRSIVKKGCDATRLIFEQCDLSSFQSIRQCVQRLKAAEDHIDILVNNAGIMFYPKFELTEDEHEMTWQSNHLGPFLLTELLLPLLEKAEEGRVVNVSSKLHERVDKPFNLDTVDEKKEFGVLAPYSRSKLANVMHMRELTRRLRNRGVHNITANSLHPGVVDTELSRHMIFGRKPFTTLGTPIKWMFMKTERDGAQTSLFLALSKHVKGVSGCYFSDCRRSSENPLAMDDRASEHLYNYSLQAVGLA